MEVCGSASRVKEMAYIVKVDAKQYKTEVVSTTGLEMGKYRFKVFLDGKEVKVELANPNHQRGLRIPDEFPFRLSLIVANKLYEALIETQTTISINGERFYVDIEDERLHRIAERKREREVTEELSVTVPMSGLIIEVEVKEGDRVKAGAGLAIVEAMKMQNEIKAPRDGIVKKIAVKKGMTVNSGDTFIVIE